MAKPNNAAGLRVAAAAILLTSNLAGAGVVGAVIHANAAATSAPGLRVLASEPGLIRLELTTGAYTLDEINVGGEIYQHLTLPGTELSVEAGAPQLPIKAALLGVPTLEGLSVTVEAAESEAVTGLHLAPAPALVAPEAAFEAEPTGAPTEVIAPDAAIYAADQNYPGRLTDLGETGLLRDQAVAQVRLYPVQYNPVTGVAQVYHRLVVALHWDASAVGVAAARPESAEVQAYLRETLLNGADLALPNAETDSRPAVLPPTLTETGSITPSLKISVTATGIYRLTYAAITGAGFPSNIDPRTFKLKLRGVEVPIQIIGEGDGVFNASDYILFYGQHYEDVYTNVNVYWLEAGGANGLRMAAQNGAPGGASVPTQFPAHVHAEVNQNYWFNVPNGTGQEHWFWGTLLSPNTGGIATFRDYSDSMGYPPAPCGCLTFANISTTALTATINVRLRGYTSPSHRTAISVNGGAPVITSTWSGQNIFDQTAVISHSKLINGSNIIRVATVNISGAADQILVDYIDLDYWDRYVAENNGLLFGTPTAGAQKFQVTGFTTNTITIYNVTTPTAPAVISNATISGAGTYTATFQATVTSGVQYYAVAPNQWKSPAGLALDTPSNWRSASNGADWIIITYDGFLASAQTLANFRAGQGLRTAVVKVQDLYDEFNDGLFNPQAIKDFLDYAYDHWQSPAPAYVVLLGDACQDYKNARFDTAFACTKNYVPTQIFEASLYGQVASDYWFTTFNGNDLYSDIFIGRLSAQTAQQASDIVSKIIAYYQTPPADTWNDHVLLVADDVDTTFETISNEVGDTVPAGYVVNKVYARNYPPSSPAAAISSQINAGSILVNYFGHGEYFRWGQWTGGDIYTQGDINALSNTGKYPVVTIGNCLNGLFNATDNSPAMAETWQRAANKGAVAVWAPTNLGFPSSHRLLMLAFYGALFDEGLTRLGAATARAAQAVIALNSGYGELAQTYLLFGDPATRMILPEPEPPTPTPPTPPPDAVQRLFIPMAFGQP